MKVFHLSQMKYHGSYSVALEKKEKFRYQLFKQTVLGMTYFEIQEYCIHLELECMSPLNL